VLLLCDALKEHILSALGALALPVKGGEYKVPAVFVGWLPPKRNAPASDPDAAPYVRILPVNGSDPEDPGNGGICSVKIEVQAWTEDADGWRDCLNVFERLRWSLLSLPGRTLAGKYMMTPVDGKVMEWRLFEDQPYPFWMADMTVHFVVPAAVPCF